MDSSRKVPCALPTQRFSLDSCPAVSVNAHLQAALALIPSVLFLLWFLRVSDRSPEPARVVGLAYLGGCGAFGLAVLGLAALEPALVTLPPSARMFVAVAPLEELLKLGAVLIAAGLPTRWGRMTSGLVYAIAASLGFAAVENVAYTERFGIETGVLRSFTAVPGHALHGALVGIQLGRASAGDRGSAVRGVLLGLVLASLAHGLYNALLLQSSALRTLVVPLLMVEAVVLYLLFQRAREEDLSRIVEQLRLMPILAGASTPALRMLATRSLRRRVTSGERVFAEGDDSRAVYLLLGGRLAVDRLTARPDDGGAREHVADLDTGAFFGEMGVLMDRSRSASVRAEKDSIVLELSRTGLHEAVAVVDGLAEELRETAADRGISSERLPSVSELYTTAELREQEMSKAVAQGSLASKLRDVPLLGGIRTEVLRMLAAGAVHGTRKPGDVLLAQGNAGDALMVILSGSSEVRRDGQTLATLEEGDWFGEISLLTGYTATASVIAKTPMELAVIEGDGLRGVIALVPSIGDTILTEIQVRLDRDDQARSLPVPAMHRRLLAYLARTAGFVGFGRAAQRSPAALALTRALPELLELPASAAETLAELGSPAADAPGDAFLLPALVPGRIPGDAWALPRELLADALARSPHLIHVLARRM